MRERNAVWQGRYGVGDDARFAWSLVPAEIVFERDVGDVVADLILVGSAADSEGTFVWGWANANIPDEAKDGLEAVRRFGTVNNLLMLIEPTTDGEDGEECLAIAGRLLDAAGVFIARQGDVTMFFALSNFRVRR